MVVVWRLGYLLHECMLVVVAGVFSMGILLVVVAGVPSKGIFLSCGSWGYIVQISL